MNSVTIREAVKADAVALARLKRETFRETFLHGGFAIPYPASDLAVFEEETYGEAAIIAELADTQRTTWVVSDGELLLGYAHVGPTKLPHPEARPEHGELYQLYLLRRAQGLKLGGQLLTLALNHLSATRPGPQWLGVWSQNLRAQALYVARGFEKVGEYEFPVGTWRDRDFIFRRDGNKVGTVGA